MVAKNGLSFVVKTFCFDSSFRERYMLLISAFSIGGEKGCSNDKYGMKLPTC